MTPNLPKNTNEILEWKWEQFEPLYQKLVEQQIDADNVEAWLLDWSKLSEAVFEQNNRLFVATTVNTADEQAEKRLTENLDTTFIHSKAYEQKLKEKLLASGFTPRNLEVPIRNLRAEAELYCEENVPLLAEEQKLNNEYDKITGAQTFQWDGEERTFMQMYKVLVEENDRLRREQAWRVTRERILADKPAIHDLWKKLFALRQQIAKNAGFSNYRDYAWKQKLRFDYTPEDCKTFNAAIEEVVVPAARRVYERRRQKMGVDTLRPWDTLVDPLGRPALKPFTTMEQLMEGTAKMFDLVDPILGRHFRTMMEEDLLDLDSRKNKASGAYMTFFESARKPFIFGNSVGLHYDVVTLLHEGGHAFHGFEAGQLPYLMQLNTPMEFNEVASMSMELLGAPYLVDSGMYTEAESKRARIEHLEGIIEFWPYMSLVDMFQHWMYENPEEGSDPEKCDAKWNELNARYLPSIDRSGVEHLIPAQWHRQGHIHQSPFYYIEYGLAQLGAVQVWANALKDQSKAVREYRAALALGATVTLPELFQTAGARLAFDAKTLKTYVDLIEEQIEIFEK